MRVTHFFLIFLLLAISGPAGAMDFDNKVTVLYDGYLKPIEGKELVPGVKSDGERKAAVTISMVQGKDITLVADPGMAAPGAWQKILAQLQEKNVRPEDVTHVFISHHHPDHLTKVGIFPNAILVDFWGTYKDDHWADHPDNYQLAPGITVIRTPGHTNEDATLLVETKEGNYAFTHLWWAPDYQPETDPLAENPDAIGHSRKIILEKADWIVPGHGSMFKNTKKP